MDARVKGEIGRNAFSNGAPIVFPLNEERASATTIAGSTDASSLHARTHSDRERERERVLIG